MLKLPVFGNLFRKVAIARFSRNFSTMMGAGVPILQSLGIVGETSGNWQIEKALKNVADGVRGGQSIAAPLMRESVFPPMVTQMVAVGEDAGALQQMLEKIADFYDEEVQSTTEQLTALIEPLMIAFHWRCHWWDDRRPLYADLYDFRPDPIAHNWGHANPSLCPVCGIPLKETEGEYSRGGLILTGGLLSTKN